MIVELPRRIVANAGEAAAVVLAEVKKGKGTYGYNAATGEYGDLVDMVIAGGGMPAVSGYTSGAPGPGATRSRGSHADESDPSRAVHAAAAW